VPPALDEGWFLSPASSKGLGLSSLKALLPFCPYPRQRLKPMEVPQSSTGVNLATVSACRFGEYGSRSRVSVVNSERVVCAAPRLPVRSPMEGGNVALFLSTGGSYVDSGIAVTYSSMKTGATLYAETLVDPTASDGERPVSWE
jgi:hypothetical protein